MPSLSLKLKNKVALVTGASSGIGRAAALAFADAGADVVLVARRKERLDALAAEISSRGRRAYVIATDLGTTSNAEKMIDDAAAHFGRLDVVVNNAGYGMQKFFDETTLDDARRLFDLNFFSVVAASRAALPHLAKTGGAIVNVASVAGLSPMPLNVYYAASKHALVGFGDSLAFELQNGVRVMTLCPGPVRTEFADSLHGLPFPKWLLELGAVLMDSPETIATAIVRASRRRRSQTIVPSWRSRMQLITSLLGPITARAFRFFIGHMREKRTTARDASTRLAA